MLNLTLIAYGSQAVLTTLLLINSLFVYQSFASLVSIFSCLSNILSAQFTFFTLIFFFIQTLKLLTLLAHYFNF